MLREKMLDVNNRDMVAINDQTMNLSPNFIIDAINSFALKKQNSRELIN